MSREPRDAAVLRQLKGSKRKWLYQSNGNLVSPAEASKYSLDTDIYGEVQHGSKIYAILEFKRTELDDYNDTLIKLIDRSSEEKESILEALVNERYGMSLSELEIRVHQTPVDKLDPIYKEDNEYFQTDVGVLLFPERPIEDLMRLKKTINQTYKNANIVQYRDEIRSVRITKEPEKIKTYLKDVYGYEDNNYLYACQLCKKPTRFIEGVQIQGPKQMKRELHSLHLSLCPDCAETYRVYRRDEHIHSKFLEELMNADIEEKEPISVPVGQDRIYFTATHLAEIQLILSIEREIKVKEQEEKKILATMRNPSKPNNDTSSDTAQQKRDVDGNTSSFKEKSVFSVSYGYGDILEEGKNGSMKIYFQNGKTTETLYSDYHKRGKIWKISVPKIEDNTSSKNNEAQYIWSLSDAPTTKFVHSLYGEGVAVKLYIKDNDTIIDVKYSCGVKQHNLRDSIKSNELRIL